MTAFYMYNSYLHRPGLFSQNVFSNLVMIFIDNSMNLLFLSSLACNIIVEKGWCFNNVDKTNNDIRETRKSTRSCGENERTMIRIIGGKPSEPKEWPWMVALIKENKNSFCGGVLITDRHILTAAHCLYGLELEDVNVRLGVTINNLTTTEIHLHPDFNISTYENDIGMIKIHPPTQFNERIWPICLPPVDDTFENKTAIVIGWGTRYYGGPPSEVLMEVTVPIWWHEECTRSSTPSIKIDKLICAGAPEGGKDACQGDSGGPLLYQLENGRWITIGIVSWGIRCGEPDYPGIYTRVNSYLNWIFSNAIF